MIKTLSKSFIKFNKKFNLLKSLYSIALKAGTKKLKAIISKKEEISIIKINYIQLKKYFFSTNVKIFLRKIIILRFEVFLIVINKIFF